MTNQTSTLSDIELDRVTGGAHGDPVQKPEEKFPSDPTVFGRFIKWLTSPL
jgi:hypothetical protein